MKNDPRRSGVGAKPHPVQKPGEVGAKPHRVRPRGDQVRRRDGGMLTERHCKVGRRRRREALPSVAMSSSSAMVKSWRGSAGQGGAWSGRSPARYWQSWRHRPARWQCSAPRNPHSRGRGRGGALQANQDGGAANNRSSTKPHQLQDPSQATPSPVTRRPSKTLRWRDANVEPFKKKATRRRGEALPSVAIGSSRAMVTSWHGSAGQGGAWSG